MPETPITPGTAIDPMWEIFCWGFFGAFMAEFLALYHKRRQKKQPFYVTRPFYIFTSILMMLSGGILVLAYIRSGYTIPPLLAVNIGASTPFIIGNMISNPPEVSDVDNRNNA